MKKQFIAAVVLSAGLVSGCAMNPATLSRQSDLDICQSYGVFAQSPLWRGMADSYKRELERRNLLTESEWASVSAKQIRTGMSQCALYASWGKPDRENRSVGPWGVHIQYVYNAGYRYIQPSYVYTENGRVTSWQD